MPKGEGKAYSGNSIGNEKPVWDGACVDEVTDVPCTIIFILNI